MVYGATHDGGRMSPVEPAYAAPVPAPYPPLYPPYGPGGAYPWVPGPAYPYGPGPGPYTYLGALPGRSSAAVWSLVLGIVGVVTAPLLGGIVPGVLAVTFASSAQREIAESEGWLTGTPHLAGGRVLGWVAIWLAITMAVAVVALWLIGVGDTAAYPSYPHDVD